MSKTVKITVVVDNHAAQGMLSEHGFSLWIDVGTDRILFDTGQGAAFEGNLRRLGLALPQTDSVVLSHGHYDHTGGIHHVLEHAPRARIICHPGVVHPRYKLLNGTPKPIQMPQKSMIALDKLPRSRLDWVQNPMNLNEKIGITGPIPRETDYEDTGGAFFLDPTATHEDPIADDLALWIQTHEGVVVCVGCAHAGLINTLQYIRHLNNGLRVRAVIGGFHLVNATDDRLAQTCAALQALNPDQLVPCHCTGEKAVLALQEALGDRVRPGMAGMVFQF